LAATLSERVSQNPTLELKKVIFAARAQYSGPVPPPSMLREYDTVQPGFADRLISMAEKEQVHRQELQKTAMKGEIAKDKRGQDYALTISIMIILGSIGLIYTGHEISGSILAGSTLLGLAYIFITGRKMDQDSDAND
jgi:uncharacterized membrane protein